MKSLLLLIVLPTILFGQNMSALSEQSKLLIPGEFKRIRLVSCDIKPDQIVVSCINCEVKTTDSGYFLKPSEVEMISSLVIRDRATNKVFEIINFQLAPMALPEFVLSSGFARFNRGNLKIVDTATVLKRSHYSGKTIKYKLVRYRFIIIRNGNIIGAGENAGTKYSEDTKKAFDMLQVDDSMIFYDILTTSPDGEALYISPRQYSVGG